jgi:hypothetical protein
MAGLDVEGACVCVVISEDEDSTSRESLPGVNGSGGVYG